VDEAMIGWLMKPTLEDPPSLEAILNRPSWHRQAACRDVGVGTFMAAVGSQYEYFPRQLCAGCQVRPECLQTALADDSLQGFWGGTTPAERRQMRQGSAVA
jgi:WhiB family transcriptional regulator, redox-sensing transcriptional regulator